ncbi:S-adenosyl-L-methionine-dependent methyltransferase [Pholiota conissans]|uniref:DNA (cytosine-5-)-methyltransferase n=1 Tax=Pholiota conissans TaxID=109636 RepID=A0A9P5ZFX4_9AGAR|nr:S-adenosyl-L-methionine-dependent methyltransferase [Pholiota conissans]
MAPRRKTAFEVSFPEEAITTDNEVSASLAKTYLAEPRSASVGSNSTTSSLGKRKLDSHDATDSVVKKRRLQLPKAQRYRKPQGVQDIRETSEFVIQGEDPDDDGSEEDEKPIRLLDNFAIFDPKHRFEMVCLDSLEKDDGVDRQFEAAGHVSAYYENDEDEGQEDGASEEAGLIYVNLGAILRFSVNYSVDAEPFYIETQYAWYILRSPSQEYAEHWRYFCTPHRIAQIVISHALRWPKEGLRSFLDKFESKTLMGRTFVSSDISENVIEIQDIILDEDDPSKIVAVPFVRAILENAPSKLKTLNTSRQRHFTRSRAPPKKPLLGNIDLAVLKPENQNPTCVTPRIAKLAEGYFREEIIVVGSPPGPVDKAALEKRQKIVRKRLWGLIEKTRMKKSVTANKANRVSIQDDYYTEVNIDGEKYKVGDIVLVPGDEEMPLKESQLPESAKVYDYFWFAQIMYFVVANQVAHIRWFNHGSKTFLGELANPQELFLADHCDKIKLRDIIAKVTVHFAPDLLPPNKPDDFFCKFMHSLGVGAFTSLDRPRLELFASQIPPDNCPVCPLLVQRENDTIPRACEDGFGVAFGGAIYHYEDFVLYRAQIGPANIGYIIGLTLNTRVPTVTARKVGRMTVLKDILPSNTFRDERELYLTEEIVTFKVEDLLKIIYVPSLESLGPHQDIISAREDWLALSHDHFYLRYSFPELKVKSWKDRQPVGCKDLHVCTPCTRERLNKRRHLYQFLDIQSRNPLKTLDLFGGVGAFSQGLAQGSKSLKVTHAIEISPSAAKTFEINSPETKVANQCANEMLRYIIKSQQGHQVEVPKQIYDDKKPVPTQPRPQEIDVITAGFPCQSHSTLNMYKNVEDMKSNLILTTLSFMDYYLPRFAFFENVPGFLQFNLNAQQVSSHKTIGGIPSGGLKLFVRALLDLGYQVRFGLLPAQNYGTPQRRLRFFLYVAMDGEQLTEHPEPTHDFPETKTLQIPIRVGKILHILSPVRVASGIARHSYVSVADAIFDLPHFDWKNPNSSRKSSGQSPSHQKERLQHGRTILSFDCQKPGSQPYCGLQGEVDYICLPETRYQLVARAKKTKDIQHYTKRFDLHKIERVVNIPIKANADYQSLPHGMLEWQFVDPSSSVGRKKYRPGLYGRVDENSIFQTTVTNMDPTAKQCRVLHPTDHRMLTVRELARSQGFPDSFVFEAEGNNVVTMHRQIGNAVPLPLGEALGRELRESLYKKWCHISETATLVQDDSDDENS